MELFGGGQDYPNQSDHLKLAAILWMCIAKIVKGSVVIGLERMGL